MNDKFSDITSELASGANERQEFDSMNVEAELCVFIDKLPHLNEIDKYWARHDVDEQLKHSSSSGIMDKVQELKKKYQFYNFAGQLRKDICARAPDGNGNTVCNLIDTSILNISSEGKDRRWKLKELMELDKATKDWKNEKDLTKFMQRHQELADTIMEKILMLFDSEFSDKFQKFQEEMGAPRFWELFKEQRISPAELQNFIPEFNFKMPRDFLKEVTRDNLATWPPKLKKLLIEDGKVILGSDVFKKTRAQNMAKLDPSKSVADILEAILEIKRLRDNKEKELKEEDFIKMREENKAEDKRIKKEEKEKQIEKEKNLSQKEKEKKKKERKEQDKKEAEKEANRDVEGGHLSAEKKLILEFYDKSIEHAQKVIEECPNWGVDPNDIHFWGQEGVKNRMSVLKNKDNGKPWKDYVRFNSNDKHIPSNARGDGFRFRWLNVNTGSRISGAGADAGLKYMQRYKESGYQLCVLAGAFSIDWAGSDSPVYTPVEYMGKMQSLRKKLLESAAK